MTNDGRCTVHVTYPRREDAADDHWLAATVIRNNGQISSLKMESFPAQRLARFLSVAFARRFMDELRAAGDWDAELSLGWSGSGFDNT